MSPSSSGFEEYAKQETSTMQVAKKYGGDMFLRNVG
jgi:hypothetical protein